MSTTAVLDPAKPASVAGRTLVDALGEHGVRELAREMAAALGIDSAQAEPLLREKLVVAESNEALRLVASAWREGLIEEDCSPGFRAVLEDWQVQVSDVAGALALRSRSVPEGVKRLFAMVDGTERELAGVDGALRALRPAFERCQRAPDEAAWERLLHASRQSVRNEALAQTWKRLWGDQLRERIAADGGLFEHLGRPDAGVYGLFNRLAAFDARPVTPFSKMKLDLSVGNVLAHSPEFTGDVRLRVAALRQDVACLFVSGQHVDVARTFDTLFPGLLAPWRQALAARGLAPDDYWPLPLHPLNEPWVRDNLDDLLQRADLVLLDGVEIGASPSLSFRSMLLPRQCLKLPVPMQTTHLIRDIAIREIELGPMISDAMHRIVCEEGLADRLVLERDLIGLHVDPALPGMDVDRAAMLGFVSRENPEALLGPGERVVPVAALFANVPGQPGTFFFDILRHRRTRDGQEAQAFFEQHVRLVVGTQLDLYFRTGLMLEAHQQNLNIVYDADWRPRRLMYHDIPGGVAAFLPLLHARHDVPAAVKSLFYFRDTPERSVFQFVHPTLAAHLGPLTLQVSAAFQIERRLLVRIVRDEIEAGVRRGRALAGRGAEETRLRTVMIDAFEAIVLKGETLPGKMMLGRLYLQALNVDWGRKVPNPELLSERVLIPPCELRNFLTDAAA